MITCSVLLFGTAAFAQVRQGAWTPVAESFDRGYSSISYWTYRDDGVEIGGGRISVEHGKPQWDAMLDDAAAFDAASIGKLWRLGNNKWTALDTQRTLKFGDRTVDPGIYYLVLDRPKADDWRLVFVDPESVRPGLIDAWASQARPDEIPRLFSIPLRYSAGEKATELDMTLALEDDDMSQASLRIQWGTHQLETEFTIDVPSPTFYRETSQWTCGSARARPTKRA